MSRKGEISEVNSPDGSGAGNAPANSDKTYGATIYHDRPIPADFADIVESLEKALDMKLWLLVQNGTGQWSDITDDVYRGFLNNKYEIQQDERCGLVIHSPGGDASSAYKIVRLFQRRTDEFYTVVPSYAKSAATLMAIGGKEIVMGSEAELGPLDVQIYDEDKADFDSALNAVQSLERLNAYALTAFDQAMQLFLLRTGKKPDSLLPSALNYATDIVRPLVEKIDTIDLTRKSRELKEAQDYASRLMVRNYSIAEYTRIASSLCERYSTHEFVIDRTEATGDRGTRRDTIGEPVRLGLRAPTPSPEVDKLLDRLSRHLEQVTAIGRLVEDTGAKETGQP